MDLDPTRLILDSDGRYIQGPQYGKREHLERFGCTRLRSVPDAWTPPDGFMLVCVVRNPLFDAALIVLDEFDFDRCRRTSEDGDRATYWYLLSAEVYDQAQVMNRFQELPPGW